MQHNRSIDSTIKSYHQYDMDYFWLLFDYGLIFIECIKTAKGKRIFFVTCKVQWGEIENDSPLKSTLCGLNMPDGRRCSAVHLYRSKGIRLGISLVGTGDLRTLYLSTSSNGNFFRVTEPLCGEFTGNQWIPRTKASDAELWYFLWSAPWINVE